MCIDDQENLTPQICAPKISEEHRKEEEIPTGRNALHLPKNPIVKTTYVGISLFAIGYVVYICLMMTYTIGNSLYLFWTTESVFSEEVEYRQEQIKRVLLVTPEMSSASIEILDTSKGPFLKNVLYSIYHLSNIIRKKSSDTSYQESLSDDDSGDSLSVVDSHESNVVKSRSSFIANLSSSFVRRFS